MSSLLLCRQAIMFYWNIGKAASWRQRRPWHTRKVPPSHVRFVKGGIHLIFFVRTNLATAILNLAKSLVLAVCHTRGGWYVRPTCTLHFWIPHWVDRSAESFINIAIAETKPLSVLSRRFQTTTYNC